MDKLKTGALAVILTAFIIVSIALIIAKGAEKTALEKSFYEEIIGNTDASAVLVAEILNGSGAETPDELREAMERSLLKALDKEWVDEVLILMMEDILALLKKEQDRLTVTIDLRDKKKEITENLAEEIPAELIPGDLLKGLPDELVLSEMVENSEEVRDAISKFQRSRTGFAVLPFLIFGIFLLLFVILAGLPRGLKWIGAGMLISGIFTSAGLIAAKGAILVAISGSIKGLAAGLDFFINTAIRISLGYAALGFLVLAGAIFFENAKKRINENQRDSSEERAV